MVKPKEMGRNRTRCASSLGVLFLSKCPFNVFVLKTLLEFRGIEEKVTKGMTPEEARWAALRELGGVEQTKKE